MGVFIVDTGQGQTGGGTVPTPPRARSVIEGELDTLYAALPYTHFSVLIGDGSDSYQYSKGFTDTHIWPWQSTSKLVNNVIALHQVSLGRLALTDKIKDIIPGFSTVGPGNDMTLEQCMNFACGVDLGTAMNEFTSGPDAGDFAVYEAAVKNIPADDVYFGDAGTVFRYGNAGLNIFCLATMHATRWDGTQVVAATSPTDPLPLPTWVQLAEDFSAANGNIFSGIEFVRDAILTNLKKLTIAQYSAMIEGVRNETILNATLCQKIKTPGTIDAGAPTGGGAKQFSGLGEDWRYSHGTWHMQRGTTWDDAATYDEIGTLGNGGDMSVFTDDFSFVNSIVYNGASTVGVQTRTYRDAETLIREWAESTT